ncbi:MAG TPA: alpha/beta hydrolase [Steroidobacteraceae bacterium]
MKVATLLIAILIAPTCWGAPVAGKNPPQDCHIGTYRLQDDSVIDVGRSEDPHLRWRREDGTTGELTKTEKGSWTSTLGWTGKPDGRQISFSDCSRGTIVFDEVQGQRIAFDTTETRFQGAGVTLAGRLVMPKGAGPVPIVVLVHGSEHDSARDYYALQRLFPAEGIGAFVYDKRGTGASDGQYSQDYLTLSTDVIAAMREAKRLAGNRVGRIGYQAGSQGGWVAPLAATIEPVDFVIVGFGLAVSPLEEDRSAIALDVTRHGYGPDVMAKAMEVADASATILVSGFRDGYDRLDAVRKKYQSESWFKYIHGNVTFALLEKSPAELRELGPKLFAGLPINYDPMPVLRNLETPQLWILGEDDIDAPSAETVRRLRAVAAAGRQITTVVFPHAEHGIYEYETQADGTRLSTRNPDGYFAMMRDFILRERLEGAYGSSTIFAPGR